MKKKILKTQAEQLLLKIKEDDLESKIYPKIIEKVGDRDYDRKWSEDTARIVNSLNLRIKNLLDTNETIKEEFNLFLKGIHSVINKDIKEDRAISIISQHLITKRAFDGIFKGHKFSDSNPVSKSINKIINALEKTWVKQRNKRLRSFLPMG